jgi:hypothetical protein
MDLVGDERRALESRDAIRLQTRECKSRVVNERGNGFIRLKLNQQVHDEYRCVLDSGNPPLALLLGYSEQ